MKVETQTNGFVFDLVFGSGEFDVDISRILIPVKFLLQARQAYALSHPNKEYFVTTEGELESQRIFKEKFGRTQVESSSQSEAFEKLLQKAGVK